MRRVSLLDHGRSGGRRYRRVALTAGVAVGGAALFPVQALLARRGPRVEDLPPPRQPMVFGACGGETLDFVVLGDSAASGVGGPYESGVAVTVARHLSRRQPVRLVNLAVSGARTADVRDDQLPAAVAFRPDVVLVSIGANDVTHGTKGRDIEAGVRTIVSSLRAACDTCIVVCTGSPALWAVPRIPEPLRTLAGLRCHRVNRVIAGATDRAGGYFLAIADVCGPAFAADRGMFCEDGFHPSPAGYAHASAVICGFLDRLLGDGSTRVRAR